MKYWNSTLKNMSEYIPGEQPDNLDEFIKLNTNENPFPPSEKVLEAIRKEANGNLRRYPNVNSDKICALFASQNKLARENIFTANGSDEIFTLIFRGFIEKTQKAAFAYPSYSLYYTMAEANAIPFDKIELDDKFEIDFKKFLEKKYSLVIFCNPNNPTGNGINIRELKNFLSEFKGLAVVDEAYVDFYNETAINLVREFDNLIVTRSFSKSYSLAGLRVGLAIAEKSIIDGFNKLKDSYNVDRLAQAGALAALEDRKTFEYNIRMMRSNKEYLEEEMKALGFKTVPSKANFIFTKHDKISSKELYEKLKENKILIRYFSSPRSNEYVRITIGTMMEMKQLLAVLREILGE
ncbi:MAG: histidinol-phosphate transaminase [Spirochaetes bacterium]|nr:histidinol-phosphate transaminase [Spirochaetota bacterium]